MTVLLFGYPTRGEKTCLTCSIIQIAQKYRFPYDKEARSYGALLRQGDARKDMSSEKNVLRIHRMAWLIVVCNPGFKTA